MRREREREREEDCLRKEREGEKERARDSKTAMKRRSERVAWLSHRNADSAVCPRTQHEPSMSPACDQRAPTACSYSVLLPAQTDGDVRRVKGADG